MPFDWGLSVNPETAQALGIEMPPSRRAPLLVEAIANRPQASHADTA
jgi:hypothetical protein